MLWGRGLGPDWAIETDRWALDDRASEQRLDDLLARGNVVVDRLK
jgi:hypothetical protein